MKIGVFGSSSILSNSNEWKNVYKFGRLLVKNGHIPICGGYGGVMEAISKGATDENGFVIGICSKELKRAPNPYLSKIEWVKSYSLRLAKLIEVSEICVFFNGGIGTFTELLLVLTLTTRDIGLKKPCIVVGKDMIKKTKNVFSIINEDFSSIHFANDYEEAMVLIESLL